MELIDLDHGSEGGMSRHSLSDDARELLDGLAPGNRPQRQHDAHVIDWRRTRPDEARGEGVAHDRMAEDAWLILQVRTGEEHITARLANSFAIRCWNPTYRFVRTVRRRKNGNRLALVEDRRRSILPGYLMIGVEHEDEIWRLRIDPRVRGFITQPGSRRPRIVDAETWRSIEARRRRLDGSGIGREMELRAEARREINGDIRVGDRVGLEGRPHHELCLVKEVGEHGPFVRLELPSGLVSWVDRCRIDRREGGG